MPICARDSESGDWDRLWFGEYVDYNAPPDFWMVEMAGIPFGLMGEMPRHGSTCLLAGPPGMR